MPHAFSHPLSYIIPFLKHRSYKKSCLYPPLLLLCFMLIPQPTLNWFLAPQSTKTLLLGSWVSCVVKFHGHFSGLISSVFGSLNHSLLLWNNLFSFGLLVLHLSRFSSCFLGCFSSVPFVLFASFIRSVWSFSRLPVQLSLFSLCWRSSMPTPLIAITGVVNLSPVALTF